MRATPLVLAAAAASLVATVIPAGAAPAPEVVQTVAGSIAAPTRFTDVNGGFPGLGRRLWLAAPQSNGTVMHVFDVDKATWGGAFALKDVKDATGVGDLDVYFYSDFGNLPLSNTGGVSCSSAEYAAGGPGETGFIPAGSKRAIVFTPDAVNATFTYQGLAPLTLPLSGDLDVTVPVGGFVTWANDTGDYAFVRHVAADGEEALFDSSPATATGLRAGETFRHQFAAPGTYTVATSTGTGTVTVTEAGPGVGAPAAPC